MKKLINEAIEMVMGWFGLQTEVPPFHTETTTQTSFVPNGVLFKLVDGSPCILRRINDQWDLEHAFKFNVDHWPDISAKDPFEFIFINIDNEKIVTDKSKSIVANHSSHSLYMCNLLLGVIEDDFKRRYNK